VAGPPIMGGADDGFVAQLSCGPRMSRYYLQCALSEDLADWPDQRIWDEIRLRLRDLTIVNDTVHDKDIVKLRSAVHVLMQDRNLFLAGDAAHLAPVAPTGPAATGRRLESHVGRWERRACKHRCNPNREKHFAEARAAR
jgi:p-hydroxybenzoate 3-monooxygenase